MNKSLDGNIRKIISIVFFSWKRNLFIDNDKKYTAGPGLAYWRLNAYVKVTTKAVSTFTLYAWE